MAKMYESAGSVVQETCNSVMEKYHPDLVNNSVRVECLFASNEDKDGLPQPAVKLHGRSCFAICKIVPELNRAAGMADAIILIDKHLWDHRLTPNNWKPLLDHELSHLLVKRDDDGVVRDGCCRPKLYMRHHDWEIHGFGEVMERHGANSVELMESRDFYATTNGQLFFDYTQKSPNAKLKPRSAEAVAAETEEQIEQAIEVLRSTKRASTASLQRRLKIGYNRAAKLMDVLEERGVIGPAKETGPREILNLPEAVGA